MTPEQRALRDAYLAELWKPCPELPYGERLEKRQEDRARQREMEDREAVNNASTQLPQAVEESAAETVDDRGAA